MSAETLTSNEVMALFEKRESDSFNGDLKNKLAVAVRDLLGNENIIKAIRLALETGGEISKDQTPVLWAMRELNMLPPKETAEVVDKLPDDQKRQLDGAKTTLGGVLQLETFPDKETATRVLAEIDKMTDQQKAQLKDLVDKCPNIITRDVEKINPDVLARLQKQVLAFLSECGESTRKYICGVAFQSGSRLLTAISTPLGCKEFSEDVRLLTDNQKLRLIESIADKYGDQPTVGKEELEEIMDTVGEVTSDILEKVDPTNIINNDKLLDMMGQKSDRRKADILLQKMEAGEVEIKKLAPEEMKRVAKAVKPTISQMDKFDLATVGDEIMADNDKSLARAEKIKKKILDKVGGNLGSADSDDIISLLKTGKAKSLDEVSKSTMEEMLTSPRMEKAKQKETMKLAEKATKSDEYGNADTLSADDVGKLKRVFNSMQRSWVNNIKDSVLKESLDNGDLKNVEDIDKAVAQDIIEKAFDSLKEEGITPAKIKDRFSDEMFAKGMRRKQILDLPIEVAEDEEVLQMFVDNFDEMKTAEKREMMNKLKTQATKPLSETICKLGKFCKEIAPVEIRGWDVDKTMEIIEQAEGKCNLKCGQAQLMELAALMVSKYGVPFSAGSDWTMTRFNKLFMLFPGLNLNQLTALPVDQNLPDIVNKVIDTGMLIESKIHELQKLLRSYFETNSVTTLDQANALSPVFYTYGYAALVREIPNKFCADVCVLLADKDKSLTPPSKLEGHAQYCLECLKEKGASLNQLGELVCYVKDKITEIDATALTDLAEVLQFCKHTAMTRETRKKIKDELMKALGITDLASLDAEKLGLIVAYLADETDAELNKIPPDALAEAIEFVGDIEERLSEDVLANYYSQIAGGMSAADARAQLAKLVQRVVRAFVGTKTTQRAVRRKRATSALTCNDIKQMDNLANELTIADISRLTPTTVSDCISTLGQVKWSTGQGEALLVKVKLAEVYGGTLTGWTANQIENLGSIAEALTDAELGQLSWTRDLLAAHGERGTWSPEKRAVVVSKWLELDTMEPSSLSSEDLNNIGHFLCGLTPDQLTSIPDAQYTAALEKLGRLSGCSTEQHKVFAAKAVKAFGAVNTWTEAEVVSVGNIVGGLSPTELSSLPQSHLNAIPPETIVAIPPSHLSGLTADQLKNLLVSQLAKVTQDQYNAFNPSQLDAFKSILGDKFPTHDSGAGAVKVTVSFFIILSSVYAM